MAIIELTTIFTVVPCGSEEFALHVDGQEVMRYGSPKAAFDAGFAAAQAVIDNADDIEIDFDFEAFADGDPGIEAGIENPAAFEPEVRRAGARVDRLNVLYRAYPTWANGQLWGEAHDAYIASLSAAERRLGIVH